MPTRPPTSRACPTAGAPPARRMPGVFDAVQTAFDDLAADRTLTLDGAQLGHGLPARPIPLAELRSLLLHPSVGYPARDAAWTALVRRAQTGAPAWDLAVVGMLLPGLRRAAGRLVRHYAGVWIDPVDVDADVLRGLLDALTDFDPAPGRIAGRLLGAAFTAGRRACRRAYAETGRRGHLDASAAPLWPYGHPDLVLARAVTAGVISSGEADLIGATRLEDRAVTDVAADLGERADTTRHRRWRAEARLRDWLLTGDTARGGPHRTAGRSTPERTAAGEQ